MISQTAKALAITAIILITLGVIFIWMVSFFDAKNNNETITQNIIKKVEIVKGGDKNAPRPIRDDDIDEDRDAIPDTTVEVEETKVTKETKEATKTDKETNTQTTTSTTVINLDNTKQTNDINTTSLFSSISLFKDVNTNNANSGTVLAYNGDQWVPVPAGLNTDNQLLSINNNELSIENGNTIKLETYQYTAGKGLTLKDKEEFKIDAPTCTTTQVLTWDGSNFKCITSTSGVAYTPGDAITLNNNEIAVVSPTCTGTDKLQWSGSTFICSPDINTDTLQTLSCTNGQIAQFNGTDWICTNETTGVVTFTALTDTPASYTANQLVRVNTTGNALEYYSDAPYYDNTDNQNLTSASLTGNTLTITIEDGNPVNVDLSNLINDADYDITNEIQDLNLSGNNLTITNNTGATTIELSSYLDNTDTQNLSIVGHTISLTDGGNVVVPDSDTTYAAGTGLNLSTTTFNLANTAVTTGNYTNTNITVDAQGRITAASNGTDNDTLADLVCANGNIVQWDGTNWECSDTSVITPWTEDESDIYFNTGNVGIGTDAPNAKLSIFGTDNKMRLSYDSSNYADLSVNSSGELLINATSATESAMVIGSGVAQDTSIQFDGNAHDFFSGIDDATSSYVIGSGLTVTGSATETGPGTVTVSSTFPTIVTGTNTKFTSTFSVGNAITIDGTTRTIATITSDTSLTTSTGFGPHTGGTYTYTAGTKLTVEPSGNIGIGTTNPTERLEVSNGSTTGTYTTSGWVHSSDKRLKTNIAPMESSLNKVLSLENVYFNWRTNPNSNRQIGFIAQDVQEIIPEVVVGSEEHGYGMSYGNITALLTGAIKEQNQLITTNSNNVSNLSLQTDTNINTLQQLQTSVDENLGDIESQFVDIAGQINNLSLQVQKNDSIILTAQEKANVNANLINDIENRMLDIEATHEELMSFFISINSDTLVYTDDQGDLTIEGVVNTLKLVAQEIETEKLTIADGENETIGVAVICPIDYVLNDDDCLLDKDAIDKGDGKSVKVDSDIITKNTVVFTSFENNPGTSTWIEKTKNDAGDFDGFKINFENEVNKLVSVNWWLVEKNQ